MTSEAGTHFGAGASLPLSRTLQPGRVPGIERSERLERLHVYFLEGCPAEVRPALDAVLARAQGFRDGCGDRDVGDDLASVWYAAAALVALAGALQRGDAPG